ncbi:MAG: DUF1073 domain-containing protein [Bacteroidaceae bacterium]|nr:DUF1073 domain-containing protein [Bacteroidaceae bacterium]
MHIQKARAIASKVDDQYLKEVYEIISKGARPATIAGDSEPMLRLSAADCRAISDCGYEHVKARYIEHEGAIETPSEARDKVLLKIAGDTLVNPVNKVGTLIDPSVYTHSQIPVMMGPWEGSSVYAPGGLPATIIDKKARGMVMHGASFRSENKDIWDNDKIEQMEAAAEITGFNDHVSDASADAYIYGGSILYPVFKNDGPSQYRRPMDKLKLDKGCIGRWVNTDRWNTVVVPSYIVTAKDYLKPDTIYIPQSALEIHTSRMAMIKPKPVPYWVSLYNIGWAPSDMSGWLRAYYGYEIVCQSIPVMAQQMSLVLYKMPLDALNATIGPDKVKQLMQINEEKMAEWSSLSPKAVNMVGDVEVVDRTYSGFEQFIGAMKSNLASQAELPEPVLWHTPNKGFSDNTTESLLKQSETLQMKQRFLERCLQPCTEALVAHVFGTDSKEWEHRHELKMTFSKPIISTEKDLAEVGARFAASVSSFVNAGVSPDIAIDLSSQFFPTVKVTDEMLAKAKESYEQVQKMQLELGKQKTEMGQPQGNTKGKATTTGSFTKAK